jgi:predicted RNA-binding Zn-ribbon protein involved in translation (DUF1610 family)
MKTPKDKNILAQQWSVEEGGCHIDMICPNCREAIVGNYLPSFACPHCNSLIITCDDNKVAMFEGEEETCPECGHVFQRVENLMFESSFRKGMRKVEDFVLGLDQVITRALK